MTEIGMAVSEDPRDHAVAATAAPRPHSVLIVDDEDGPRDLMARWLESGGYQVMTAASAEEALGRVKEQAPAVALCDIRMPGHDGIWLAERLRQQFPETAVIMATGVCEVGTAVHTLRQGVIDYLTKPFGRERLRDAVKRGLDFHESAWDARLWRESLEQEMGIRKARLINAVSAITVKGDEGVDAMLSMLTLTDREAYAHAYRVAALSVSIGRTLGVRAGDLSAIEYGALLHDIGKLAIPEAILRKPAPLTEEETTLIRHHPALASELIGCVPYLQHAAPIVRDAHERMDGLGYPRGVHAADVALGARIVCLADAYDTMTRPRVFRDAITPGEALLEVERCAGSQFDPAVVAGFRRVIDAL